MARRMSKRAPKLAMGGFGDTGRANIAGTRGRAAAKRSAATAKGRKAGFEAKHPRDSRGRFR